jgi:hypothetical protein
MGRGCDLRPTIEIPHRPAAVSEQLIDGNEVHVDEVEAVVEPPRLRRGSSMETLMTSARDPLTTVVATEPRTLLSFIVIILNFLRFNLARFMQNS